MTAAQLFEVLQNRFGTHVVYELRFADQAQPQVLVQAESWVAVAQFLRDDDRCWFDQLSSLSGVDLPAENRMAVVIHLNSVLKNHFLTLRCEMPREAPELPSLSAVWRAADWHEREAYDLLGIRFTGHPDLRRMLLPADWEGHPLRKDYQQADTYHNIPIPSTELPNRIVK